MPKRLRGAAQSGWPPPLEKVGADSMPVVALAQAARRSGSFDTIRRAVNNRGQSARFPKEAAMTVDVFSAKRHERQVRIDPKATGIVVIDMLNEFCKAGGAMVLPGYERLIPPQKKVIDAGRHAGSPVLFVVDTHRRNVRQDREFLKRTSHCLEGSWGAQVIEDLDPRPDDLYIVKRRYSAFFTTALDLPLPGPQATPP